MMGNEFEEYFKEKNKFLNIFKSAITSRHHPEYKYNDFLNKITDFFNATPFVDIDAKDNDGRTALSLSCIHPLNTLRIGGNTVQTLLQLGADVNTIDYHGKTPIMYAVSSYETALEEKEEKNLCSLNPNNLYNVFYLLNCEPNLSLARGFENTIDIVKDKKIRTFFEDFERIRVERFNETADYTKKQKIDFLENNWRQLWRAIKTRNINEIKEVVQKIPEIVHMRSRSHDSFLHVAARLDNKDAVQYFLDLGADPTAQNSWGRTPLHEAFAAGSLEIARHLPPKLTDKSPFGESPFDRFLIGLPVRAHTNIKQWWNFIEEVCDPVAHEKIQSEIIQKLWYHPKIFMDLVSGMGKKWSYEEILDKCFRFHNVLDEYHSENIIALLKNGYTITLNDRPKEDNIKALYDYLIPEAQKMNILEALGENNEERKQRKM